MIASSHDSNDSDDAAVERRPRQPRAHVPEEFPVRPDKQPAGSASAVIGIIGDSDPAYPVHRATEDALAHVPVPPVFEWVPTEEITDEPKRRLARYTGLLIAPGRLYRSMDGALTAIRYAREQGVPLLGTCGGFQHVVVEYVRNVLGFIDADHEAVHPAAPRLAVTALTCSLAGQLHPVTVMPGTQAAALYQATDIVEPFFCSYGLNPTYRGPLEQHGMVVSGTGEDGEVRILELPDHPFFLATLYVPMASSTPEHPHPLVSGFAAAAGKRQVASS
jgi:CTP synthase (UTP-ammonia lyase)